MYLVGHPRPELRRRTTRAIYESRDFAELECIGMLFRYVAHASPPKNRIYTYVTYVSSVTDLVPSAVPRKELPDREHWEVGGQAWCRTYCKNLQNIYEQTTSPRVLRLNLLVGGLADWTWSLRYSSVDYTSLKGLTFGLLVSSTYQLAKVERWNCIGSDQN